MRLVQRGSATYSEGMTFIHFDVQSFAGKRAFTEDEFDWICQRIKRMQLMTDRTLGPDKGVIHASEFNGQWHVMLRTEGTVITDEVRSLVGWIELFGLEHEEAHVAILATAFPLGNPGFAP